MNKYNEIQLTKNKMDLNNWKMKIHTPSPPMYCSSVDPVLEYTINLYCSTSGVDPVLEYTINLYCSIVSSAWIWSLSNTIYYNA